MALPTLHREAGFEFFFRALDRPEPPHVHVRGNDGSAKVWLVPEVNIQETHGYTPRERDEIIRITEEHRIEWLAFWDRFFGAR